MARSVVLSRLVGLRACVLCHGQNKCLRGLRRRVAGLGYGFNGNVVRMARATVDHGQIAVNRRRPARRRRVDLRCRSGLFLFRRGHPAVVIVGAHRFHSDDGNETRMICTSVLWTNSACKAPPSSADDPDQFQD